MPVSIADDPLASVVLGTGKMLSDFKLLRHGLHRLRYKFSGFELGTSIQGRRIVRNSAVASQSKVTGRVATGFTWSRFPPDINRWCCLAGVLLAQVLMLAVQIKRDSRGRLIRVWTVGAVYAVRARGRLGHSARVREVWNHYFALQNTSRENEELRAENDALKLTISQLQSKAAEADRLAGTVEFQPDE